MRVLFAINQQYEKNIENSILEAYKKLFNEEFEFEKEYYLDGILKSLEEKNFDCLVIKEDLEGLNKVSISFLDKIKDTYENLNIIMVIDDEHNKDEYVLGLFALPIYNIIYKNDMRISLLAELINKPRTRIQAKIELGIDEVGENISLINEAVEKKMSAIDEDKVEELIRELNSSTVDEINDTFKSFMDIYNDEQMMFLVSLFNESLDEKLIKSKSKEYKKYSSMLKKVIGDIDQNTNIKVIEVEKEVIKERTVEKPVIIEKEVLKVTSFRSDSIITLISNCSSGKTYLGWNLAYALSRIYKVALINIDTNNSANCYFGIEKDNLAFKDLGRKNLKEVIDDGYKVNKNLTVYTGEFGVKTHIKTDVLLKVISYLRNENNIVIIDTATGLTDNLMAAINYSNDLIFVYDLDNSHLKLNNIMLSKIENDISFSNTTAVINNVYEGSKELVNVDKYLKSLKFKDVLTVRNCGKTSYDYMYSDTCNYLKDNNNFTVDIDALKGSKLQSKQASKSIFNVFKRGK